MSDARAGIIYHGVSINSVCLYVRVFSGPKRRMGRVRVHALFV